LSDRIAVMWRGRIVEIGTPESIYRRPGTRFTAEFIGIANLVAGTPALVDGRPAMRTAVATFRVDGLPEGDGRDHLVCLRREDIVLRPVGADCGIVGGLTQVAYAGPVQDCLVAVEGHAVNLRVHVPGGRWRAGDRALIGFPETAAVVPAEAA